MSDLVVNEITISVRQVQDYQFLVTFDKESMGQLQTDESTPLGQESGPTPTRMLGAAVANCLSASLLFAFRKAGVPVGDIETTVTVQTVRNEAKRLRIGKMVVTIDPKLDPADLEKAKSARGIFETFCTVTESVKSGIPVEVKVKGFDGE
jgi:uncharacterized OsmC-like protein